MVSPELIICPFLMTLVPKQIYDNDLTIITHPGPPGDAGSSPLDWLLMGEDGVVEPPDVLCRHLHRRNLLAGRFRWVLTVFQFIDEFDAGPVSASEQFPVDID